MRQIRDIYIFFCWCAFSRGKIYESKEEDLSTNQRIKKHDKFLKNSDNNKYQLQISPVCFS